MTSCSRIKRKSRKVCLGDLGTKIKLQGRNITPPVFGSADFDEKFSLEAEVWAMINTVSGRTYFDGNADLNITHHIYIRYDVTVTAETWIEFGGRRIDILTVENLDERSEYMKLVCIERGLVTSEAAKA